MFPVSLKQAQEWKFKCKAPTLQSVIQLLHDKNDTTERGPRDKAIRYQWEFCLVNDK